jgi:hypothetical protein
MTFFPQKGTPNPKPKRFRFSVLEATSSNYQDALRYGGNTRPLPTAICKNCKQTNTLAQRPLVDPPNIYFCTNCGTVTAARALRKKRGLMAPSIQQQQAGGRAQTGIVQPSLAKEKSTRTPNGIHTSRFTNPIVDTLSRRPGYQIIDVSTTTAAEEERPQ